jgi:hypothetical protein
LIVRYRFSTYFVALPMSSRKREVDASRYVSRGGPYMEETNEAVIKLMLDLQRVWWAQSEYGRHSPRIIRKVLSWKLRLFKTEIQSITTSLGEGFSTRSPKHKQILGQMKSDKLRELV